jgi:hypothetical protein
MENGKKPITPGRFYKRGEEYIPVIGDERFYDEMRSSGLTKREYFAAKAMQGFLASDRDWSCDECVEYSVRYADVLLKELAKEVKQ